MDLANPASFRPTLLATRHMIVAGHALASMVGMRVLEAGGNAIDAGVAAGFALNVVQPDMANLGGVAPIVIRRADGFVTTFAGIGPWPRAATRAAVAQAGQGRIPVGPGRWVVPAAVDAWFAALARYGTWSAADVLQGAIALADHGFPAYDFLRHNIGIIARGLPDSRIDNSYTERIFLADGRVPARGELVRQPDLADSLRRLAEAERHRGGKRERGICAARDSFYRGEIAERIDAFSREIGAFIRAEDLHAHEIEEVPPVSTFYRGRTLYCGGPWSQAPALGQMLGILQGFDLAALPPTETAHILIETVKLGLSDRNRFYGDPKYVHVPMEMLLSDAHAADLRCRIRARSVESERHAPGAASPDTTYVCVVDGAGNAFSASPSDSTILVSPLVPGLGFGISDRGLQASLDPSNPNVIAPGKRPRLTPSPMLLSDAEGIMPFGSPGGEVQLQAMLQFLVNYLDLGMEMQAAVEAPRWASSDVPATEDPHPSQPGVLRLEQRAAPELAAALREVGHDVQPWPPLAAQGGAVCAIRRDTRSGTLQGAADPRRMSYGIGW